MMRRMTRAVSWSLGVMLLTTVTPAQKAAEPPLEELMTRAAAYVAAYGQKSSVVVAHETYTQDVTIEGLQPIRPRKLEAEFAIVRAGSGWTGFRDIVAVNDEPVRDRRDRLTALFTGTSPTISEAMRIADESSRFNVGPVARNFNTPTTAMFFFLPDNLTRFRFTRKGTKTIDGVPTIEVEFKETGTPTFITTRAGRDVPVDGSLWIRAEDGAVIRTRIRMSNFADVDAPPEQAAAPIPPPVITTGPVGRRPDPQTPSMETQRLESSASVEVSYRRPNGIDLWLPISMVEFYSGPIYLRQRATPGRAVTRASYADFKQFGTTSTIIPK
jgi:hypothetical protein